jgi:hypothetical protein
MESTSDDNEAGGAFMLIEAVRDALLMFTSMIE